MWVPSLGQEDPLGEVNPLQYSGLENPMDRGAWLTGVHKVAKSQTRLKRLSTHTHGPCMHTQACMCVSIHTYTHTHTHTHTQVCMAPYQVMGCINFCIPTHPMLT